MEQSQPQGYDRKLGITDIADDGKTAQKLKFVELRAKGLSLVKCAKRLKVSKSALAVWEASLESEIASLRAIELEALQEQFWMAKQGKIELLGGIVRKLKEQADKADYTALEPDKLLELLLKYTEALSREFDDLRVISSLGLEKTGTELDKMLQRYRLGLMTTEQAKLELALVLGRLKAREIEELEARLESLEAHLEGR